MTKKHDKKCPQVPRLRFPEFQNAGKWKWNKLKEVCEINPSSGALPQTFVYIDLESVSSGKLLSKKTMLLEDAPSRAQRLVKNGDILFQMVRPYQKNNLYCNFNDTRNYVASTGYAILRASENSKFLYQAIHCDDFVDRVISKCTGSNYPAINSSHLSELVISTPILQEQQRIADCLSSLDERIAAETSKLDRLKDHKKGLLKQLFPAEGETLPQLRFPEFGNSGKWQKIALGDICDIIPGYTFPECLQGKIHGLYPFCKVSDISKAVSEHGGLLDRALNYVGDDELLILKAKPLPVGTTVFAKIGEALRLNRRAITTVECLIDNNAVGIKSKSKKSTDYFLYTLSQLIDLSEYCGGAVPSVNKTVLENISAVIPTIYEQQRIADCLSSLDELITAQTQKIDLLKEHKKGLMQQLFPRIDEVLA